MRTSHHFASLLLSAIVCLSLGTCLHCLHPLHAVCSGAAGEEGAPAACRLGIRITASCSCSTPTWRRTLRHRALQVDARKPVQNVLHLPHPLQQPGMPTSPLGDGRPHSTHMAPLLTRHTIDGCRAASPLVHPLCSATACAAAAAAAACSPLLGASGSWTSAQRHHGTPVQHRQEGRRRQQTRDAAGHLAVWGGARHLRAGEGRVRRSTLANPAGGTGVPAGPMGIPTVRGLR